MRLDLRLELDALEDQWDAHDQARVARSELRREEQADFRKVDGSDLIRNRSLPDAQLIRNENRA